MHFAGSRNYSGSRRYPASLPRRRKHAGHRWLRSARIFRQATLFAGRCVCAAHPKPFGFRQNCIWGLRGFWRVLAGHIGHARLGMGM